jgi:outer membrane receptor for ferrienterochelin and colicins
MRKRSLLNLIEASLALAIGLTGGLAEAAQSPSGTVRVEVSAAGTPVEGAIVSAGGQSATTDASGLARLTLPPGPITLVVTRDGYAQATARVEVVETTRTRRPIDDQAVLVDMIGREAIERNMLGNPGDVSTLFNWMSGLRTQSTSTALGTTTVLIHGLPGRYTRLLADGVPVFGDRPGGHALLRIPPMDLDRVEIIKGPMSALYGADALAGTINFLSRAPGTESSGELLFSQSSERRTDGAFWLSTPATSSSPSRKWSTTFLADFHRQEERDVDDDGWSDLPGYRRGTVRPRVFWDNKHGRTIVGVATATIEKRNGGSDFAREALETKTADGTMSGQMILDNGKILAGAGTLFVQSRTRDFGNVRERDRLQTATIDLTLRRPSDRHTWLAGMSIEWYAVRSLDALPSTYVSTRGGLVFQDDFVVAPWLVVSGSARLDHHNLYNIKLSPRGSVLMRTGRWSARFSAAQGYFTPRHYNEETDAAGLTRLTVDSANVTELHVETARSASADVTYKASHGALTLSLFRTKIDDPAQIDRATYTLRTETEPIVSRGAEISGTVRRAGFSVTGNYLYLHARERGDRDLARTPRHSAGFVAAVEGGRGRVGVEVLYTGTQRLDANPYRTRSEAYTVAGLLGEVRFGRARLFVNADNLTDVRQTNWDPIAQLSRHFDGRWTVDAWAPLAGRVINAGLRVAF